VNDATDHITAVGDDFVSRMGFVELLTVNSQLQEKTTQK